MQNHLRRIRESRGMTLDQVAQQVNSTKAQVSKLERGLIHLNDMWLDRLSKVYNVSIHEIIDDDEPQGALIGYNNMQALKGVVTVAMKGFVDGKQSGLIEYAEPEQQYIMSFARPKGVEPTREKQELFAFTLRNGTYHKFKAGTELVFSPITDKTRKLLKAGAIILCTTKDNQGNPTGEFLREIEFDAHGYPYAAFKIKHGKSSATTLANTLLAGDATIYDIMKLDKETQKTPPKSPTLKEIPLENREIDIKAVLVKSVQDE